MYNFRTIRLSPQGGGYRTSIPRERHVSNISRITGMAFFRALPMPLESVYSVNRLRHVEIDDDEILTVTPRTIRQQLRNPVSFTCLRILNEQRNTHLPVLMNRSSTAQARSSPNRSQSPSRPSEPSWGSNMPHPGMSV